MFLFGYLNNHFIAWIYLRCILFNCHQCVPTNSKWVRKVSKISGIFSPIFFKWVILGVLHMYGYNQIRILWHTKVYKIHENFWMHWIIYKKIIMNKSLFRTNKTILSVPSKILTAAKLPKLIFWKKICFNMFNNSDQVHEKFCKNV